MYITDEEKQILEEGRTLIGIDEVGRGAIFGPISIGVTIFDYSSVDDLKNIEVDDSKKLSEKKRKEIVEKVANKISYIYDSIHPEENLCEALSSISFSIKIRLSSIFMRRYTGGMENAVIFCDQGLKKYFDMDDFNDVREFIKGDSKYYCIALASVIAKVSRDTYIKQLAYEKKYSHYDLKNNKGYGTPKHWEGIKKYGLTDLHRLCFKNVKKFEKEQREKINAEFAKKGEHVKMIERIPEGTSKQIGFSRYLILD